MHTTHTPSSITRNLAEKHTFSSKERDVETGLSYFGARYYSSDLSIWLSVDPMADKYPSLSPYTYCADNPVKLVDPNGEDFETEINFEDRTIVIKATYFTLNENRDVLQKGIDVWNSQSGKFAYVSGEGDAEVEFSIVFDLKIAEGDFQTINDIPAMSQSMNFFDVVDELHDESGAELRGICRGGNIICISKNYDLFGLNMPRSTAHEIGHSLGCGDYVIEDLMKSGGRSSFIGIHDIQAVLFMGGFDSCGSTNLGNGKHGKCCDAYQLGEYSGRVIKR